MKSLGIQSKQISPPGCGKPDRVVSKTKSGQSGTIRATSRLCEQRQRGRMAGSPVGCCGHTTAITVGGMSPNSDHGLKPQESQSRVQLWKEAIVSLRYKSHHQLQGPAFDSLHRYLSLIKQNNAFPIQEH